MRIQLLTCLSASFLWGACLFGQESLQKGTTHVIRGGMGEEIPCAFTPTMDGIEEAGEWSSANFVPFMVGQNTTMIGMMHDETHLYFLFRGYLESEIQFPEIYIDANNSKDSTWQSDDWWFHVSATDCDNMGAPDVYTNCQEVQTDWLGVNNIQPGAPVVDTVEIAIPFSKIGFDPSAGNPMGLAFGLNNVINMVNTYPQGANMHIPASWLTVMVLPCFAATHDLTQADFSVFPNPTKGELTVQLKESLNAQEVRIYSLDGMLVATFTLNTSLTQTFTLPEKLESGTYLLEIEGQSHHRSIVLTR